MKINELKIMKSSLADFSLTDYFQGLKKLREKLDLSQFKSIRIAVLRSYTCEILEPILSFHLLLEGYKPEFYFCDFNQYSQDVLDVQSKFYQFHPGLVLFLVRIEELLPPFLWSYSDKKHVEWQDEFEKIYNNYVNLINKISEHTSAQILIQNLYLVSNFFGIQDGQQVNGQKTLVQLFNQRLKEVIVKKKNTFIWDFEGFVAKIGYNALYDPKMWYVARNPYKQTAYMDIARELLRYVLSINNQVIKCVVVDLDNTLWGGVIGEDGLNGIALGQDYPGNCFVDFQKELLRLYKRGIILAINSKNNEADVFAVLDKHPDMVLRRQHFAVCRINWEDKVSNLKSIAEELNIGSDSIVFIDDNSAECALVRGQCSCLVMQMPNKPYLIPQFVNSLPWIEKIYVTDEDLKKGVMYQEQLVRKKLEKSCESLEDFLTSLKMEVQIREADNFNIPRIAQLTQKTNQFNMTTRRYQEADILNFANSGQYSVFVVSARDCFGEHGNIGVFILKFIDQMSVIDTFLLSCRVIGRTIEETMLAFIADFAFKRGAKRLVGEFIASGKNVPAKNFYLKAGMIENDDGRFFADLHTTVFRYSPYIKLMI